MADYRALVETVAKGLVNRPDDVQVTVTEEGGMVSVSLKVHPDDMGRIIGRRGSTVSAIRQLLSAAAAKAGARAELSVVEQCTAWS